MNQNIGHLIDMQKVAEEFGDITNWVSASASATINVVFLFIFLSIFFWLVISKIETETITREVNSGIAQGLPQLYRNLDQKYPVKPYLKKFLTRDTYESLSRAYDQPDITYTTNNDWVLKYDITLMIFLVFIFISMIVLIYVFGKHISLWTIVIESAIILCLVGIVEYYFFTTYATKYVPVKPSFLLSETWNDFLETLKN